MLQKEMSDAFKQAAQGNLLTGTFCGYTLMGAYEVDAGIPTYLPLIVKNGG